MAIGRIAVVALGGAALVISLPGAVAVAKTKIACVGASTTSGDGSTAGHHYPDELQRLEGADAEVRNFGVSGTTMLRAVSASYWSTTGLTQALAYQPDVAIIWFGGNDAKPENWTAHKGEFLGDYEAMIRMFQALPSHPRTYVILSLLTRDTEGIPKAVVDGEVIPLVRQAAADTGSGVVDVHDDLADHPEYFPDGIHPNDTGTVAVAKLVYAVISAPPDASVADGPVVDAPVAPAFPDAGAETADRLDAPAAGRCGDVARRRAGDRDGRARRRGAGRDVVHGRQPAQARGLVFVHTGEAATARAMGRRARRSSSASSSPCSRPRAEQLRALGEVNHDASILIGGFVPRGAAPRRLLVSNGKPGPRRKRRLGDRRSRRRRRGRRGRDGWRRRNGGGRGRRGHRRQRDGDGHGRRGGRPRRGRVLGASAGAAGASAGAPGASPDAGGTNDGPVASDAAPRGNRVLIYTRATGFVHDSTPTAAAAITKSAAAFGLVCETSQDQTKFTPAGLAPYAAIVLLATTGTPFGSPGTPQIQALVDYVQGGGGLVAIENANHAYDDSVPYISLIGGDFNGHSGFGPDTCYSDGMHPTNAKLPAMFPVTDEIYYTSKFNPDNQVVLRCGSDKRAISWVRAQGAGRVFYTALGHGNDSWTQAPARRRSCRPGAAVDHGSLAGGRPVARPVARSVTKARRESHPTC